MLCDIERIFRHVGKRSGDVRILKKAIIIWAFAKSIYISNSYLKSFHQFRIRENIRKTRWHTTAATSASETAHAHIVVVEFFLWTLLFLRLKNFGYNLRKPLV